MPNGQLRQPVTQWSMFDPLQLATRYGGRLDLDETRVRLTPPGEKGSPPTG
jgi:hypothetical protein